MFIFTGAKTPQLQHGKPLPDLGQRDAATAARIRQTELRLARQDWPERRDFRRRLRLRGTQGRTRDWGGVHQDLQRAARVQD